VSVAKAASVKSLIDAVFANRSNLTADVWRWSCKYAQHVDQKSAAATASLVVGPVPQAHLARLRAADGE